MNASQMVAFSGPVIFWDWIVHSEKEPKIRFKLESREALAHFDKATRRRKNKAGQRYLVYLADANGDAIEDAPDEAWLWGSSWTHTQGATIALAFTWDAWLNWWVRMTADLSESLRLYMTLVELGPDDAPVNQIKADRVLAAHEGKPVASDYVGARLQEMPPAVTPEKDERLKGGPLSKNAARLCRDPDFFAFVREHVVDPGYMDWQADQSEHELCARFIRVYCEIQSRAELDHYPDAAKRFEELKGHYLRGEAP